MYGARSGDKGGCANIGVWAKTDLSYSFLYDFLTVKRLIKCHPFSKSSGYDPVPEKK